MQLLPFSFVFVLGLLEWVFPCFSHTTIPKVQRIVNLVDLEKCELVTILQVSNESRGGLRVHA